MLSFVEFIDMIDLLILKSWIIIGDILIFTCGVCINA